MILHAIFQKKQLTAVRELEAITGKKKWGCGDWKNKCGPVAWKGGRWGGYGRCGRRWAPQTQQVTMQPGPQVQQVHVVPVQVIQ